MICVIDNYDSFTYNLVQYLGEMGQQIEVFRNDEVTIDAIRGMSPSSIVVSPGPGRPEAAGISCDVIRSFHRDIPILGVCLGHQAIAYCFGGDIVSAHELVHGKPRMIHHDGRTIYRDIVSPFEAGRYHSLAVSGDTVPGEFEVSAWTDDRTIMGIRHREYPVEGIQFHPESILTPAGKQLIANFLCISRQAMSSDP